MTKKQLYNSKVWKDTRQQVLRRDLFTCRDCHSRASEVHHIKPLTPENIDNWDISLNPNNLISLCKKCHSKITDGYTGDIQGDYIFNENGEVVKS